LKEWNELPKTAAYNVSLVKTEQLRRCCVHYCSRNTKVST